MSESLITDDRGSQVVGVSIAMIILSTHAVAFRLWSRKTSKAGLWWDDWTILIALVSSSLTDDAYWIQSSNLFIHKPFAIGICALSIYWVSIGFGRHSDQVKGPATSILLAMFCENFMYNTGLTLVKVSVLLFYSRVFTGIQWLNIALRIVGAIVVSWWIICNFGALFTCDPIAKAWDSKLPGHCTDTYRTYVGAAIPNVFTDFVLLILPMPILWKLHMTKIKKVALCFVFGLGYW